MTQHHAPDAHLPMLTVPQAERLRNLAADYFLARDGTRPTIGGGAVERGGRLSPLTALAQRCRTVAERHWPELVAEHFARLESASQGDEGAAELLRQTYLRLLPADAFPADAAGHFRYARPVAEDLVAALALDTPTSIRLLNDADVARAGLDELWAAGRANLLGEPVEHVEVRGPSGALLHSVSGASHFIASKALMLPELAQVVTGRELPEAGALVAVPTRHLLAFHPIVDGTLADAVNELGTYALGAYEDGPGSLTPRLYWWHQSRLVCLTVFDHENRSLSVQPPQELLEMMKTLRGEQETAVGSSAADVEQLACVVGEFTERLEQDPGSLGDAFAAALTVAHARCADDPDAAMLETWESWVTAMQVGSAMFATTLAREGIVECRVGDRMLALPATGPAPYADARAWLDAFWLALVCRETDRLTRLSQVPLDDLRRASNQDDYVFHWIDTLQSHWLRQPMDDIVPKLLATMETSHPHVATRTPKDFLDLVDYQPVALCHRLITNDHAAFAEAFTEALAHHDRYWNGSTNDPRGRVALGPLAMACLAHDWDFPIDTASPYLPKYLLNREWCGEFPT
ncbi:immunity 49 family protein [Streptomyces halobius]|uniref:Immunity 49 family protein n=1 Tax=Streptomyces halobius TaxID=2879846 RepID=A0ABY4M8V9_9ACTN|nr:immunity 49 family protein [Streptomyces halobius]UQA93798.1 immunity 49 family protein [Streptomyces halobius]